MIVEVKMDSGSRSSLTYCTARESRVTDVVEYDWDDSLEDDDEIDIDYEYPLDYLKGGRVGEGGNGEGVVRFGMDKCTSLDDEVNRTGGARVCCGG